MSRTLSEELVKVPGQEGDLLLPRETVVEVEWPNGNRVLGYVDEGGLREIAGKGAGDDTPCPWYSGRVVRVFTEDKAAVKENDYGKEHAMDALEFASTESWLSDEAENAAKTGDATRATYWMRRWSEFREAFPEFATLCRACRLDVASGVGDGLCDWCAENM